MNIIIGHLLDTQEESFTSTAKVLFSGLGADEQLGGYGRHAARFNTSGWSGLCEELQLDIDRLPHRNLGRDDRVISDHGKEVRFPFLDERVLDFVSALPAHFKADLRLPRGLGDKFLLRWMLHSLHPGMASVAVEPKRAIQFGARTAKIEGNDKGDFLLTLTRS